MRFIKTTLLGGLGVVLPILLLLLAIREISELLVAVVDPIARLFPEELTTQISFPGIVAAFLVTLVSFIAGLFVRWRLLTALGARVERSLLEKLPMYRVVKRFSGALISDDTTSVAAAVYKHPNHELEPCYVIEEHSDDRLTILKPLSPTAFSGSIRIVNRSDVEYLRCSFEELSRAVSHFGIGMDDCLAKRSKH